MKAEVDPQALLSLVQDYRLDTKTLERVRETMFQRGTHVRVDCDRYKGFGYVVTDSRCHPDQVAVRISNGNTWYYPIESVKPV